ncbi:MAG TPA: hypothetical protein ACHBX0_07265 [Arsenophonus sp.]
MKINEIYHLQAGEILNIPVIPKRRTIRIPLLLAIALNMRSQAEQKLIFNGSEVAKVKAQAGGIFCDSWSGFIKANNSASIQLNDKSSHGGNTPKGITIFIGDI